MTNAAHNRPHPPPADGTVSWMSGLRRLFRGAGQWLCRDLLPHLRTRADRRPHRQRSRRVCALVALAWALGVALGAFPIDGTVRAVGRIESRYVPWPVEAIEYVTPVDGYYMLIVHHPTEGDDLYAAWKLEAGLTARTMLPRLHPPGTSYHIQVMEDPNASMVLLETLRYQRALQVTFLGMLGNG